MGLPGTGGSLRSPGDSGRILTSDTIFGTAQHPRRRPPRIYVACLAAYNAGRLHGRWIDANRSVGEISSEVQAMLAESPETSAEEWAIHDYDGFGSLRLGEWETFERISAIAAGLAEHAGAFAAWLSYDSCLDPSDARGFAAAYRGEWETLRAYAESYADDTGLRALAENSGSPYVRVDVDALERDLDIELYTVASDQGTVYVFDPNG